MSSLLTRRMALLAGADGHALLAQGLRGIEREALRVDGRATWPPRRIRWRWARP